MLADKIVFFLAVDPCLILFFPGGADSPALGSPVWTPVSAGGSKSSQSALELL